MSEHQRETAFLRDIIAFDGSDAGRQLASRLVRAENNERCVQRAALLVGGCAVVCAVGLGYGTVLQENFFFSESKVVVDFLVAVGLASLLSLLVFVGLFLSYRKQLRRVREECRLLMTKFLETRLGSPRALPSAVKAVEIGRGTTEADPIAQRSEPSQT